MKSILQTAIVCIAVTTGALGQLIFTSGPLVTHPGGGAGGADASALETTAPLALNIFGFGVQGVSAGTVVGTRCADDFTVPCGQVWFVSDFSLYTYQTNSGLTPSITGANYRIWSGSPMAGGSIIHDFSGSNQMAAVSFSNIYRVLITGLTGNTRPIMKVTIAGNGIFLAPGTYWLDWTIDGSLASGPWAPPVSILGQGNTGNAIQNTGAAWAACTSNATLLYPQGLTFDVNGTITPIPCFSLNITQAGGPGTPVTLADTGGLPATSAFNIITLNQGAYPAGWLFGLDIPWGELVGLLGSGAPFNVGLDGTGTYSLTVPVSLPFPITLYYLGLNLNGPSLFQGDVPKSVTIS